MQSRFDRGIQNPLRWICYINLFVLCASIPIQVKSQTVDSFNPNAGGGFPSIVYSFASQRDGKLLVGGRFTALSGQTRYHIGRFQDDGSLDTSFNPVVSPDAVNCLAVQSDGMILVGGGFTTLAGQTRNRIGRLTTTGILDTNFNPNANGGVNCLVIQPDKKILVGGSFSMLRGSARVGIGRLNLDGTLDTFDAGADGSINSINYLPNGKMLVGGSFTTMGGQSRQRIAKLQNDGTLDNSFNAQADATVHCLVLQPDGKILVGGGFTTLGGQPRNRIGRLNSDGTLDLDFNPDVNGTVYSMALQADGKIHLGGDFTTLGGENRNRIARIQGNGSLDQDFDPNANHRVFSLAIRLDGKILAGGEFTIIGGASRSGIAQLNNSQVAFQSLGFENSTITWTLADTSADFSHTSFDVSIDGNGWINLGDGERVSNGWQIPAEFQLPLDSRIRARGYGSQGYQNGSQLLVESLIGGPVITHQPANRINNFNTHATFSIGADGDSPLSFQWMKDGVGLTNGGKVSGVISGALTLSNVFGADAGGYSVVVSDSGGSITSAVATLTVLDPFITSHPTNQAVHAGQSATFRVSAIGSGTLAYQWRHNGINLPASVASSKSAILTLSNVQLTNIGHYDVVVSNSVGTATSQSAQLNVNLSVPDTLNVGANNDVYAMTLQQDQKIVFGGSFSALGQQIQLRVARLHTNGLWDSPFNPRANHSVFSSAIQMDGKILICGWFTTIGGQSRTNLARLQPDGSLDMSFDPNPNGGAPFPGVYSIAIQPDGKILVMGSFTALAGQACTNIGRLNIDGTLDPTFQSHANNVVYPMALQPDGKILLGGDFTMLGGLPRKYLGRLNNDGSVDTNFNPGASSTVLALAVQPDGKILVGGVFTNLAGVVRTNLGRLNPDGSFDNSFTPDASDAVRSFALQTDGKILVGGSFTVLGGQPRLRLGRLSADGAVDSTFFPDASGSLNAVHGLTIQPDGKVLVGGSFFTLGGQSRGSMGRLTATEPVIQSFSFDGSTIQWLRSGSGPEFWRTAFDISTNGASWTNLGAGERINGGWQRTGLALPTNASVRARGFVVGGRYNCSTWFIERTIGPPVIEPIVISEHPISRTNNFGTTAIFTVDATGSAPLNFRWIKDGVPLTSPDNPEKAMLTVTNVSGANSGNYSVIVSNISGSVTSQVAALTVIDPFIIQNPASRTNNAGTTATFSVNIGGSVPRTFQWWKNEVMLINGGNISGATNSVLSIENVLGADAGEYFVTVTGTSSNVTSSTAFLTVHDPVITGQPASQSVGQGSNVVFAVVAIGSAPLNYQWRKNGVEIPNETNATFSLTNLEPQNAGIYDVIVTNTVSTTTSTPATLSINQVFPLPTDIQVDSAVYAFAHEPAGTLLIGGAFTSVNGNSQKYIARLGMSGSIDTNFHPEINGTVHCISLQPDGKILVGGQFTIVNGQTRTRLARLNHDGALDMEFNLAVALTVVPYGSSSYINALLVQSDGKILVGGAFTSLANQQRKHLGRLNADGTLDEPFNANIGDAGNIGVQTVALQPDGKILVGGNFSSRILRLNADGTLDTPFNPTANGTVRSLLVQPDGKIVLGGSFTTLRGQDRFNIGRLNDDGTLDTSFDPKANDWVYTLVSQTDGKIIVAGKFTTLAGQPRQYVGRLHADGMADTSFAPVADNSIYGLALDNEGKIWAGGDFSSVAGSLQNNIIRLNNTDEATSFLSSSNSVVTWRRGGSSPEVWRTIFEISANGTDWQALGDGLQVPNGWDLSGVNIPVNSTIRARGFVSAGYRNGSVGIVESIYQTPPMFILTADGGLGFDGSGFGFNLSAPPGQTVIVEGSSNLVNWTALETNVFQNAPFRFNEPAVGSSRFYRLRAE